MVDDDSSEHSGVVSSLVIGVAMTLGIVLMLALVPEWFGVYFRIDGEVVTPTSGQELTFVLTASIGLGLLLLAAITAFATERRGAATAAVILLLVGLGLSALFRVPQDFGAPPPATHTAHRDYTPCYSGSTDPCPGG